MPKFCDVDWLKTVYYAYNSNIANGIKIYIATAKKNMNRILLLQKRALRIIFNLG